MDQWNRSIYYIIIIMITILKDKLVKNSLNCIIFIIKNKQVPNYQIIETTTFWGLHTIENWLTLMERILGCLNGIGTSIYIHQNCIIVKNVLIYSIQCPKFNFRWTKPYYPFGIFTYRSLENGFIEHRLHILINKCKILKQ